MDRDGRDKLTPSTGWPFAPAIYTTPRSRSGTAEKPAKLTRAELVQLAMFSERYERELYELDAAEAEARHDRELLEWSARISERAEETLRALEYKEAQEREAAEQAEHLGDWLFLEWGPWGRSGPST